MASSNSRGTRYRRARRRASRRWLAALLIPASGFSQSPSETDNFPIEEIVITARKTEEHLQDVPMSVQVLSADVLDDLELSRIIDLQYNVPGLIVNNLGLNGSGFSMRGVASVATYLNGVYSGTSNLATTRMFDLERVEVLKGPQGTLYGRNATGGSINLLTQLPKSEFSAGIEAAHGSFDTARVQGHVNVPFRDSAFRLSYIGSEGDGFIRNSVDDRKFAENDYWGVRGSLLLNPADNVQINVMAQHVVDDGARGELWLPRPDYLADPSDIRLTTVTLANPFLDTENDNVTLNVEFDLEFATLRAVSGYARSEVHDLDDCAGLPILRDCVRGVMPLRHKQLSQEVQLVSRENPDVDWIVGAYYYSDEESRHFFTLTPVIDPNPTNDRISTSQENTYAAFGQVTWHVGEKWSATTGMRLNNQKHSFSTIGTGTEDSLTLVSAENSLHKPSWRFDLEYSVADQVLIYAGISTGFRSGGYSIVPGGILDGFGPEDLTSYETGVKSQWLDQRITLNGAAFFYDFRDLQVATSTITPNGLIFETDNAARAEIYGIDTDGLFHVSNRLSISAGVVWLPKREFVAYRNDRTGDTLSGNKLIRSPEWTVTASVNYDYPIRRLGSLSTRIEYNFRSDFFYRTDNNPLFAQDSFGLLNVFLNFEPTSEKWYVFASGRNLGDVDYYNQIFIQSSPGLPDTYEAGFGFRF